MTVPISMALARVILDEPRKVGGVSAEVSILLEELVAALFGYLVWSQAVERHTWIRHSAGVVLVVFIQVGGLQAEAQSFRAG
jgi:hypothetical protein